MPEVARRDTDFDFIVPGIGLPLIPRNVEVSQCTRLDGELNGLRFARLQRDFGEALQFANRPVNFGVERLQIKFHHSRRRLDRAGREL